MTRLNWDRVRAENIVQRRRTVDSDDSVGIARETYASRLQAKGREYSEITSNKVVAEFLGCNPGQASNVRKAVAEKNGWKIPNNKIRSKKYQCKFCNKRFSTIEARRDHRKSQHKSQTQIRVTLVSGGLPSLGKRR